MTSSDRTKDRIIAIPVFLILLFMVYKAYEALTREPVPQERMEKVLVRNVQADPVVYSSADIVVSGNGRVVSGRPVSVFSQGIGELLAGSVPLKVGQRFNKGDTLVNVSSSVFVLQLAAQRSNFLNSLANVLPEIELDYPEHAPTWTAYFERIQVEDILPQLPVIPNAKLKTFLSARGIVSAFYDIKANEKLLDFYTYEASFDGTISAVHLDVGSYATKGALVAEVVQRSNVEVEVPVAAKDVNHVSIGDKAHVWDEISHSEFEGTVVRISDLIDPKTQSRLCFVRIPFLNRHEVLAEGMYPHVDIYGGSLDSVYVLPRSAVFNSDEVFIVQDSLLFKKQINLVRNDEENAYIRGLPQGQFVVSQPLPGAREGNKVAVIPSELSSKVVQ